MMTSIPLFNGGSAQALGMVMLTTAGIGLDIAMTWEIAVIRSGSELIPYINQQENSKYNIPLFFLFDILI
ncbi:MAG: hypothetical protein BAJALOKI2v1_140022 [Promethearchaeota archaeon]|nr:MAG: hypothetical protein BAJALOKI2v1_140022 [Candidatus Lokiarchaeota archaeon]